MPEIRNTKMPSNSFNPTIARMDFPILSQIVHGKPLIYFDNAASSQKPVQVINALSVYYSTYHSNVHRGVHHLSGLASNAYDSVRIKTQKYINSESEKEIVFVRGTTEGINLITNTFGTQQVKEGDEIILSEMEHHSNIVPWQILCDKQKASIRVIPMNEDGELIYEEYIKLFNAKTKLVAMTYVSNSLGTINPIKQFIDFAHKHNVPVIIDAAQAVPHMQVDVQALNCDFLAFSGHKMLGPTGTGILYGKLVHLESMPPFHGGGDMIASVSFEKTTYADVPSKFEAGTPNIADVIAFGVALDYMSRPVMKEAFEYEENLLNYGTKLLEQIPGLRIIGTAYQKTPVLSFVIEGLNALDVGMYLDTRGIAVRTGQHCTEPVMKYFGIPGTIRASFMFYNLKDEIDQLYIGLIESIKLLRK